jgi:hypothetical protein
MVVVAPPDTPRNRSITAYQVELQTQDNIIVYNKDDLSYTPSCCTVDKVMVPPPVDTIMCPDGLYQCWMLVDYADINLSDNSYRVRARAWNVNGWSEWSSAVPFAVTNGTFHREGPPTDMRIMEVY